MLEIEAVLVILRVNSFHDESVVAYIADAPENVSCGIPSRDTSTMES
jgi:hypothetical protein